MVSFSTLAMEHLPIRAGREQAYRTTRRSSTLEGVMRTLIIDQATGQPVTLKFEITAKPPTFIRVFFRNRLRVAVVKNTQDRRSADWR